MDDIKKIKLGVVGATGLVGETLLSIISEEGLYDIVDLTLYVSDASAGKTLMYMGREYRLITLHTNSVCEKFDAVIFSAGDEVSRKWAKTFAERGAFVIDNSNAFRRDAEIPLVVPEINEDKINNTTKIIANPNCSTIQLVLVLDKLLKISQINKVVVSTYQSVSGAGKNALLDLNRKTNLEIKEGITNNYIAKIGEILPNGFSVEEDKMMFETSKILDKKISLCATAVRVPVPYCHGESVYIEFKNKVNADETANMLKSEEIVVDKNESSLPTNCSGKNLTFVSRIRNFTDNEISLFIVADNLRRGAAYNAIKILKILIDKYL